MKTITLTADQAKLVMQCLDLAVKTVASAIEQQLAGPTEADK